MFPVRQNEEFLNSLLKGIVAQRNENYNPHFILLRMILDQSVISKVCCHFFQKTAANPLYCLPFSAIILLRGEMIMKNILLIKSISRYASLDRYIDEWADAIRKLGCNTCVLDAWSLAQPRLYAHIISAYHFDVIIDINVLLADWNIFQNLPPDTIYATYLCDPAYAFRDTLQQATGQTIVFACDNHFRKHIDRYFTKVLHSEFIPLSGSACPVCVPYEERAIDILFTGTYESPQGPKEELLARFANRGPLFIFLKDMLEDIVANPQFTLPECLSRILEKYQVDVSDSEFDELTSEFLSVDFYARFYYREKVIRSLLDAGLTYTG